MDKRILSRKRSAVRLIVAFGEIRMFAEIYPYLGLTRSGAACRQCLEEVCPERVLAVPLCRAFCKQSRSTAAQLKAFPSLLAAGTAVQRSAGAVSARRTGLLQRRLCFPWLCCTKPGAASPGEEVFGACQQDVKK